MGEPTTHLIMFGGYAENVGEVDETWRLEMDAAEGPVKWSLLEVAGEPPAKRYGHTATALGENIVVFGGQGKADQYNDVWLLSTGAGYSWSCLAKNGVSDLVPRTRHSATALAENRILVVGGFHRQNRALDDVWALTLTLDGVTWEEVAVDCGDGVFEARAQHAAASPDGRHVYIFGG